MNYYEAVSELNKDTDCRMFTVCDGELAGSHMIMRSGAPVWTDEPDGFLAASAAELAALEDNCLTALGGARVFAETLGSEKEMVICGAGHVSMPVIEIAKMIGFRVTAIDDRKNFIDNALSHGADGGICRGFEEALADIPGSPDTYFIIVTRGHSFDTECLLSIVKKQYAYIGMIGSRRKVAKVKQTLADAGVPQDVIDSVHTPIGLDIGAETPEEIAVSIMAEIIAVKNASRRNEGFSKELLGFLLTEHRDPAVLATIVSKKGSSPRGAGTRMAVKPDGSIVGTIGGGLAEAMIIERAKEMLAADPGAGIKKPVMVYVDMTGKEVAEEGMICGGAVEVLLETV